MLACCWHARSLRVKQPRPDEDKQRATVDVLTASTTLSFDITLCISELTLHIKL